MKKKKQHSFSFSSILKQNILGFPITTSQTPIVTHSLYKAHKSTTSDLNIKIVIDVVT